MFNNPPIIEGIYVFTKFKNEKWMLKKGYNTPKRAKISYKKYEICLATSL
jgi:hypothetical protein